MKKFKKSLVSVLVASSCLFSAVGINGSAFDDIVYPSSGIVSLDSFDHIQKEYGLVALDDELGKRSQFQCNPNNIDRLQARLYYFPGYEGKIVEEGRLFSSFELSFKINEAYEDISAIEELINETFGSSYSSGYSNGYNSDGTNYIRFEVSKSAVEPETIKLAKELKEKLEQHYEFEYFGYRDNVGNARIWQFEYGGYMNYGLGELDDEKLEILKNYFEENNINASIEIMEGKYYEGEFIDGDFLPGWKGHDYYTVVTDNMNQEERFSLAVDIYEDTGIKPWVAYNEGGGNNNNSIEIDMLNSIEGDANNDGQTTIADATAIVQALGNPDEYALSAQGKYNADSDSDGLTGMDAIRIQETLTQSYENQ